MTAFAFACGRGTRAIASVDKGEVIGENVGTVTKALRQPANSSPLGCPRSLAGREPNWGRSSSDRRPCFVSENGGPTGSAQVLDDVGVARPVNVAVGAGAGNGLPGLQGDVARDTAFVNVELEDVVKRRGGPT